MLKDSQGKQMSTAQKLMFLAAYVSVLVMVFRA
jgi:hypothetical protein